MKPYWIVLVLPGWLLACLVCWPAAARGQIEFDRPKDTLPLPTPYTIAATRARIMETGREILTTCDIPFESETQSAPTVRDRLVTKNVVFTRGVNVRTDLEYYSDPPADDVRVWTEGRVRLEIIALPLDAERSQIQIVAHVQGRPGGVTGEAAWVDCPSKGRLEDEVLRGLAGKILGIDLSVDRNGRRRLLNCEY